MNLRAFLHWAGRNGKRAGVTIAGFGILVAGLVMLVLPGPGLLAVVAGLAILATEYAWARRWLAEARRRAKNGRQRLRRKGAAESG